MVPIVLALHERQLRFVIVLEDETFPPFVAELRRLAPDVAGQIEAAVSEETGPIDIEEHALGRMSTAARLLIERGSRDSELEELANL